MSINYNKVDQDHANREFLEATRIGDLQQVKYYLTSPELKVHADIHTNNSGGFINACGLGSLDIIKYLLTSPDLKEHADIHVRDDACLYWAARMGHLDIIQYLLTSPELKERPNVNSDNSACFKAASDYHEKEIMKYLISSKDLTEKTNISQAFIDAYNSEHLDIIQFMIFDLKIEKSEKIKNYLSDNPNDVIEKMFELRDFNTELNKELISNNNSSKKIKI